MKKLYILFLLMAGKSFYAQTEIDGIMMEKNNFAPESHTNTVAGANTGKELFTEKT